MIIKNHQSFTNFLYGAVTALIALSKSKGSAARAEVIKKSKTLITIAKYLKRIMQSAKLIIIIATISASVVQAKDFGTRGHTYQIVEQGFLEMIDQRLQKVDMEKEQEKMTAVVKDKVANPAPVKGIEPAIKRREFYFDPTYTLEKDAILPCGKVLHKAGTKINPLEEMQKLGQSLSRRMIFVDASRKNQVKWLKKQLKTPLVGSNPNEQLEDRIILISGKPFEIKEELGEEHKNKVYFDQAGEITTKFGIKASPAVVVQDGLMLKIEEVKLAVNYMYKR